MMRNVMTTLMRLLALTSLLLPLAAQAERNMAARYITNSEGDITLIGNAILTCTPGGNLESNGNWNANITTCAATLAGTGNTAADRNDGYTMINIDVDSDSATFNSSTADLSMPSGSTVLFAGLYWSGISTSAARGQVLFKTPSAFGYSTVNASTLDTSTFRTNSYHGFADVTNQVKAAGNGTYGVANVQADTGDGNYAAWSLIVVYKNTSLALRNLAVYDGFMQLAGTSATVPVSGFLTPLSGPVNTRLGVLSYEGDRPATGDTFSINSSQLTDANNPVNNFYNATISDLGVHNTARNPASINNTVFDIDRINVPVGIVGNGATSATITVSSPATTETFLLGAVTFATDLYVPIVTPNIVKTATDVNGGDLVAGDVLRWTVTMSNTGLDTATNLTVSDPLPSQVTYVPGSLNITSGANAGSKTDASGDDVAEYVSASNQVVFRLGTSATSTAGGNLPYQASTAFTFDTTVNSGLPAGTQISNVVNVSYRGQTIGDTYAGAGAAASAVVLGPPVTTKSFSPTTIDVGGLAVLTIVVSNPAANQNSLNGVAFTDTYPSGLINAASPSAAVSCSAGSTAGTVTAVAGGNSVALSGASIAPNGNCTVTVNVTSNTGGSYVNTISGSSSTNGGTGSSTSATLAVGKPTIAKAFSPTSINSGGTSTITFTLNNPTNAARTGVAFSDALTSMQVASTPAVSNSCGGTVSAAAGSTSISLSGGSLAANGSCTVSVNVTSSTMGLLANTATGVSTTETGSAGNPSNTVYLTVVAPPAISKSFYPTSVQANVASQMTIVVSNPNSSTTITGAAFTDTYPSGMRNDTPANPTLNCSSGSTATLTGGADNGTSVGISGGSLAPGGSCTITVNVEGTTTGDKVNTISSVTTTNAGTNSTGSSATLNITALTAPGVTKSFAATSIAKDGTTTLSITISNSNTVAINGIAFTDNYPLGMSNATTPAVSNTCGGTATATAGGTTLSLTGGSLAARINSTTPRTCVVSVTITSNRGGYVENTTGIVTTSDAGTFGPSVAGLNVLSPPQLSKTFSPDAIAVGNGTNGNKSLLTLTFSNPTTATVSLTGVGVVDNFPGNVFVHSDGLITNINTSGNTCATVRDQSGNTLGQGDTGLQITGITLAPNTTCTVAVRVYGDTAGSYTNTTNAPTATNAGNGTAASAVLTIGRPSITKSFATSPIVSGGTSVMTITLSNPTGTAMTSAAFTDTYPTGMTNAATPALTNNCGGTATAAAGTNTLSLSGGSIPARSGGSGTFGTCTIVVTVTATATGENTIAPGGLTVSGGGSNGSEAAATLVVYNKPQVVKAFSPSTVLPSGTSVLSITVTNTNGVDGTSLGFTDTFPSGMVVAGTPSLSSNCGTVQGRTGSGAWGTVASGNTAIRINSNGTVLANSTCTVSVNVTASTAGNYSNSTGSVTSSVGTGDSSTAVLTVMAPPTLAKAFSPASVLVNEESVLTLTFTNSNTVAITGAALTDTYPSGLVNAATPNASTSCSGATLTATAGGNSVAISGATVPASSSCTLTIRVKSAAVGSYANTTGTMTTTNAGTSGTASATLTVTLPQPALSLMKLMSVLSDPVNGGTNPKSIPGAISSYTLRITNSGPGTVDANPAAPTAPTFAITDPLPAQLDLYVGDIGASGSGPFVFTNGTPSSGLTCTYVSLASTTDCVEFSTNGTAWTATPTPDANGFDSSIRYIRFRPSGSMNAASGSNPYAEFLFRVRVK